MNTEKESNSDYRLVITIIALLASSWCVALMEVPNYIIVLWPAVIALATILFSKKAALGLMMGALTGCLILSKGHLLETMKFLTTEHLFPSLQGSWHIGAILFTLVMGAFAVVIERGGGFTALAHKFLDNSSSNIARKLESATGLMGALCFFDGLANSLLLGKIMRPLADKTGVTRAKLAYLVDSTSSSIACIAFISTWIATQLSLIQQSIDGRGIEDSAYALFFQSISHNFYCLFTLILVALVIWKRWNIGPMRSAKVYSNEEEPTSYDRVSVWIAITPILLMSLAIVSIFYVWETSPLFPITTDKLTAAFSGSAGPYALTLGSVIGLGIACFMFPKGRKNKLPKAVHDGASSMLTPLLILVMAWTFGSVMKELGTAEWLAEAIGSKFSHSYFPAAVFITGAAISFLTGSSWGTMALLMPLALPAYLDMVPEAPILLPAVIGAVFSGAVFGDHCSPFSDTTIVSAFACGISAQEHVITQLPYALLAAGTALGVGFIGLGLGLPAWLAVVLGASLLFACACFFTRQQESSDSI